MTHRCANHPPWPATTWWTEREACMHVTTNTKTNSRLTWENCTRLCTWGKPNHCKVRSPQHTKQHLTQQTNNKFCCCKHNHATSGHSDMQVQGLTPCETLLPHKKPVYSIRSGDYAIFPPQPAMIARFLGPTWGPSGTDRTQVGPMLAPCTLLSGRFASEVGYRMAKFNSVIQGKYFYEQWHLIP